MAEVSPATRLAYGNARASVGDDEGAGDDERVFREGAYVRCGLLALILAVFGLGVRLRRVAGAPTTRRLASRSIELTSHAS